MPKLSWSDFQRHNPSRSPRWRYERVRQLVDHRPAPLPPVRNRDDKWVRAARNFLIDFHRVNRSVLESEDADYHRRSLWASDQNTFGMYLAYDLGTNARHERTRCEIEARILARQTDAEIASLLGLPSYAIRWYEALFFNVRDRLSHKAYITSQVLFPNMISSSIEQMTLNASAKFFGYFAGDIVLSAVLDAFDANIPLPKDGDSADEFLTSFFAATLHRRSAEAIKAFEINRYTAARLFDQNLKMIEIAVSAKKDSENLTDIEDRVKQFFNAVPWATSERREAQLKDSPIATYVGQTVEPRANEYFEIVEGQASPALDALRDQEFPHIQD